KLRRGKNQEGDVPERGGEDGALRKAAIDPGILEKTFGEEILLGLRAAKKRGERAAEALAKFAPADFESRRGAARELQRRGFLRRLTQKIERVRGLVR